MPVLSLLATADADQARQFFADIDAEELVAAIARTDDDELLGLIARPEVRAAGVPTILSRLEEFAIAERLAGVRGVVRFDLMRRKELLEREALRFTGGGIESVAPDTPADVVLTTSLLRFVRIISGERNAGLELLGGTLDIDGDADLALAVGGIFKVPGRGDVAVDPAALDPVDVASVLSGVPTAHLRKVMGGGFRPVVLGEIFRRLPEYVDHAKVGTGSLVVGFRLTGAAGGEVERYVVEVAGGQATVHEGEAPGLERDATITCGGHDFLRLATGHLSPVTGVLKGTLKVKGSKQKALAFSAAIDFPQPR